MSRLNWNPPREISDKYDCYERGVFFEQKKPKSKRKKAKRRKAKRKKRVGFVADYVLFYHGPPKSKREFWKGAEFIKFDEDGRIEVRLMYWARKKGTDPWYWGQFCLCLREHEYNALADRIDAKLRPGVLKRRIKDLENAVSKKMRRC